MTTAETSATPVNDTAPAGNRPPRWWRLLGRDRAAAAGAVVLTLLALVALFGRLFIGDRAQRQDLDASLRPPSLSDGVYGLLGTDVLGRSVLARLIGAVATTLSVAVPAVLCSLVIGSALGLWAGYHGGRRESLAMRVADVILSFPSLLIAVVVLYVFSPSALNIVLILAVARIPVYLRTSRAEAAELRSRLFVDAARTFGTPRAHHPQAHPADRPAHAADRRRPRLLLRDAHRVLAEFPRHRNPAPGRQLGPDGGPGPAVPPDRLVDHGAARSRHRAHHGVRHAARRVGPDRHRSRSALASAPNPNPRTTTHSPSPKTTSPPQSLKRTTPSSSPKTTTSNPNPKTTTSQPKPENNDPESKPNKDDDPKPKPQDNNPAPNPEEDDPKPKPEDDNPAPKPEGDDPELKPENDDLQPKPENNDPESKPDKDDSKPKPENNAPAPNPEGDDTKPKPQNNDPAPKPEGNDPQPKPNSNGPESNNDGPEPKPNDDFPESNPNNDNDNDSHQ